MSVTPTAPATVEPGPLLRCCASVGFYGPRHGKGRAVRASKGCGCVFHELEVDADGCAPCGHEVSVHGATPILEQWAARYARPEDIDRWRKAIAETLLRMDPEIIQKRFLSDVIPAGYQPRTRAGASQFALWLAEGPERGAAWIIAVAQQAVARLKGEEVARG